MRRMFRAPALSVALFALWLLLDQSLGAGSVLVGLVLAVFWPAALARFVDPGTRVRKPLVMAKLFARVLGDMLKANVQVIGVLLTRRPDAIRSRFVSVPLELSAPAGLSLLALIVTFTPGTVWAQLSADRRALLLHVFSASDDGPVIATIKGRYERPLREIFE